MRFLPTMLHGILDYVVALVTIGLPFVLRLQGSQRWTLLVLGLAVIIYSALTDYEGGVVRYLVDVNLKGLIDGAHVALKQFRVQGYVTLINTGSISETPLALQNTYAATKAAV